MCSRFQQLPTDSHDTTQALAVDFHGISVSINKIVHSPNIAPTDPAYIIFRQKFLRCQPAMFGLIPSWSKTKKPLPNARGETVTKLPAFRDLFATRRCLIPITGYYEWKKLPGEMEKTPFKIAVIDDRSIKMPSKYFYLAGLWNYIPADKLLSFTILTTEPNELVASIHDRMPVILDHRFMYKWLSTGPIESSHLEEILKPYPADTMELQPYSQFLNRSINKELSTIFPTGDKIRLAN